MEDAHKTNGENPQDPAPGRPARRPGLLSVLLFAFGLWGLVAPYLSTAAGFPLPVPAKVEFVDHVVPGIVVLGVASFWIFSGEMPLVAALAATLGGFWMTMTHIFTIRDGLRGLLSLEATLIHSLPGIAILIVAGAAAVKAYRLAPD